MKVTTRKIKKENKFESFELGIRIENEKDVKEIMDYEEIYKNDYNRSIHAFMELLKMRIIERLI